MSDIAFYCVWCRHRLVVDDRGAGMEVPCPLCGKSITIPAKPVWLPAINKALAKIVQDEASGKIAHASARMNLKKAIITAGYHPGTAGVQPGGPEDLLSDDRFDLILSTNFDIMTSIVNVVQGNDPDVIIAYPAWEFSRLEERKEPRDWPSRWRIAARAAGDIDALNALENFGVMAALKNSKLWAELGSTANFDDALDNDFSPFAWGTGMWQRDFGYDDCLKVGLMQPGDKVEPRRIPPPPPLIPIEDERITSYLWNLPDTCDHCGQSKARRLLFICVACCEFICPDCKAKGCSGGESVDDLCNALKCSNQAIVETMGLKLPFPKHVAERILQLCDRAFDLGFAPDQRYYEAQTHRMRGEAFESLGRKDLALREYELATEKDPEGGVEKQMKSLRKEPQNCLEAPPQANPFAKAEREVKAGKQEEML